jgi:hypothetical protein
MFKWIASDSPLLDRCVWGGGGVIHFLTSLFCVCACMWNTCSTFLTPIRILPTRFFFTRALAHSRTQTLARSGGATLVTQETCFSTLQVKFCHSSNFHISSASTFPDVHLSTDPKNRPPLNRPQGQTNSNVDIPSFYSFSSTRTSSYVFFDLVITK